MDFPKELKYTQDHEWILLQGTKALVGVTHYAVEQLGDIVHLELPEQGVQVSAGDSFGTIESTKTVSDLYLPITAKVLRSNKELGSRLEDLQKDPYQANWLVEVEVEAGASLAELMGADEYRKFVEEQ